VAFVVVAVGIAFDFLWLIKIDERLGNFFARGLLFYPGDFPTPPKKDQILPSGLTTHHFVKMGREEQIEEREVLDSIFPEEITGIFSSCLYRAFALAQTKLSKME
jgi:hypothetical protein